MLKSFSILNNTKNAIKIFKRNITQQDTYIKSLIQLKLIDYV